jgi:hypothetical protein
VSTTEGPVLLSADACWLSHDLELPRPAHLLTRGILWDSRQAGVTVARLAAFRQAHRHTPVIPTHCADSLRGWIARHPEPAHP